AVRPFRDHDVGNHAREVGLESQSKQVEHQFDLLGKVFQFPHGSIRNLQTGKIRCAGFLSPPLDLADRFQIAVEDGTIVIPELGLEFLSAVRNEIKDAASLTADECALVRRVSFTEQVREN